MQKLVYNELNKTEDTTVQVKTVSEYKFLDRYGEIGEYIRLELKLLLRNKVCRQEVTLFRYRYSTDFQSYHQFF